MNDSSTPLFATANALDQLTVRALSARPGADLDGKTIADLVQTHGGLTGRSPGSSFQRVAAAAITYRRNFALPAGWTFAGANVVAGLIAWQNPDSPELVMDRLCARGITSFAGLTSVPLTQGTRLRVCDLTNPQFSKTYVSHSTGWDDVTGAGDDRKNGEASA